ncbi:hypothetical protein HMPREF1141_1575 [Clostridium sp. MSTE9]|nr:hypothetical protein HMPREF1141_1575 [Clostridium sp. MSTE9]
MLLSFDQLCSRLCFKAGFKMIIAQKKETKAVKFPLEGKNL